MFREIPTINPEVLRSPRIQRFVLEFEMHQKRYHWTLNPADFSDLIQYYSNLNFKSTDAIQLHLGDSEFSTKDLVN